MRPATWSWIALVVLEVGLGVTLAGLKWAAVPVPNAPRKVAILEQPQAHVGSGLHVGNGWRSPSAVCDVRGADAPGALVSAAAPKDAADAEDEFKDVLIAVQEAPGGSLMIGVGVNSDSGLSGSIVLNERNFDAKAGPLKVDDLLHEDFTSSQIGSEAPPAVEPPSTAVALEALDKVKAGDTHKPADVDADEMVRIKDYLGHGGEARVAAQTVIPVQAIEEITAAPEVVVPEVRPINVGPLTVSVTSPDGHVVTASGDAACELLGVVDLSGVADAAAAACRFW